jgi:hypothetical protein
VTLKVSPFFADVRTANVLPGPERTFIVAPFTVACSPTGVGEGGIAVFVGVGGTAVSVGGTGVFVGGTGVFVGVGGTGVFVAVGGTGVFVGISVGAAVATRATGWVSCPAGVVAGAGARPPQLARLATSSRASSRTATPNVAMGMRTGFGAFIGNPLGGGGGCPACGVRLQCEEKRR